MAPSWSSFAELHVTPTKGRHLVARSNLPSGHTVIDTTAFAASFYDESAHHVCANCFSIDASKPLPVACAACDCTSYCSDYCRDQHAPSHSLACRALQYMEPLKQLGSLVKPRLMLEVLVQRYHKGTAKAYDFAELQFDCPESGWLPSPEVDEWCDALRGALAACAWASSIPAEALSNDALITMASQIDTNGFDCLTQATHGSSIGIGVYLDGATFLNHDCEANCDVIHAMPSLVVRTNREVARGEPLCIAYINVGAYRDVAERRERLRYSYGFECDCRLCCAQSHAQSGSDFSWHSWVARGAAHCAVAATLAGLGYWGCAVAWLSMLLVWFCL
jgi:hypothetical protein